MTRPLSAGGLAATPGVAAVAETVVADHAPGSSVPAGGLGGSGGRPAQNGRHWSPGGPSPVGEVVVVFPNKDDEAKGVIEAVVAGGGRGGEGMGGGRGEGGEGVAPKKPEVVMTKAERRQMEEEEECKKMLVDLKIVPDVSWGKAQKDEQRRWDLLSCNSVVAGGLKAQRRGPTDCTARYGIFSFFSGNGSIKSVIVWLFSDAGCSWRFFFAACFQDLVLYTVLVVILTNNRGNPRKRGLRFLLG